jgi:hydroxypyruvate reductase
VTLREQAEAIWAAGVAAVDSSKLVRRAIQLTSGDLVICGIHFALDRIDRIVVVGGGKAGAGMSSGLEQALGPDLVDSKLMGWVNVPADCVRPLRRIHLHSARPAGVNEPTADGVAGCERMLQLVGSLSDRDVCLVLISGGGSALMPAPVDGISLDDKLAVTRHLMRSGATIHELNTVRKRLSRIKGGGLLRAARAGQMLSMIISDVVGDPLDIIASGPTVFDTATAFDALSVLEKFGGRSSEKKSVPDSVWRVLNAQADANTQVSPPKIVCRNQVIGNNQTALTAAIECARGLNYEVRSLGSNRQGIARDVGIELAELCLAARRENNSSDICIIGGGEPVVKLAQTTKSRRGGRNQEVALAAGCRWGNQDLRGMIVLSAGTDGEDGPTDAAGASFDEITLKLAEQKHLNPKEFLAINDSYTFFEQTAGLMKTGPTHTNVMDLQIALVEGRASGN